MEDGFFHADPHPGNILINNGKICFIDFGMIGELSNEFISRLNNVIIGLVIEDIDIVVDFILYVGIQTGTVKREQLYEDVEYLYNKWYNMVYVYVNGLRFHSTGSFRLLSWNYFKFKRIDL